MLPTDITITKNTGFRCRSVVPTRQEMTDAAQAFRTVMRTIPDSWVIGVSTALYSSCALVWDYVDTVIDICAQQRFPLKKACRRLRQLRTEYERFRASVVSDSMRRQEEEIALTIEDDMARVFRTLSAKVERDLIRIDCPEDRRPLQQAVIMADIVLKAVEKYSLKVDREVLRMSGLPPVQSHMFLQNEIVLLFGFMPQMMWEAVRTATRVPRNDAADSFLETMELCAATATRCYEEDQREGGAA